jgi:acyl-CoA ligase (AMP-forming) (exosortase A-associated)
MPSSAAPASRPEGPAHPLPVLLQDLLSRSARHHASRPALVQGGTTLSYTELDQRVARAARGLAALLPAAGERVAVYLPKTPETVVALFASAAAGAVCIPVNPVLKSDQVRHILKDSGARILVTSASRLTGLAAALGDCPALQQVLLVDAAGSPPAGAGLPMRPFSSLLDGPQQPPPPRIDADLAAILYTSGSSGQPRGVMLSHRNLVAGAASVASYLGHQPEDRILALLPLSFDAGFSQLTTSFIAGASVVLLDYLLPADVRQLVGRAGITGLTAVPPLWSQLGALDWPPGSASTLRYFASTGGQVPPALLERLRQCFPQASPFLMYGLTEAFRSTFLAPAEVDRRPGSIGRAIPNAEVLVLRPDGTPCAPGETGELVHRGALVTLGYWNAPEATARRFRPLPAALCPGGRPELAVYSGDLVRSDAEGYLYFVGRSDARIKTSGYRVSPEEVESAVQASGLVGEVVAFGLPDERLGERIVLVATPPAPAAPDAPAAAGDTATLLRWCQQRLPSYLLPQVIEWRPTLPRNANGKFDRVALRAGWQATPP